MNYERKRGFTLIELLLVIAIVAIIGSVSISTVGNYLSRNYFIDSQNNLVGALRTAHLNTLANKSNGQWGVRVTSTTVTLFQGSTYAGRTPAFDQVSTFPVTVTVTGIGLTIPADIIFSRLTGNPNLTGTIRLTGNTGEIVDAVINPAGVISVN